MLMMNFFCIAGKCQKKRKFAANLVKMNEKAGKHVVAINTRHWIPGKMEGVGRFEMNIAIQLSNQHPEVDFHWIFDRKPPIDIELPSNVTLHNIMPKARHPLLIKWWYNISIPRLLRKIKADVFLSADNIASDRVVCKSITVIHDIFFEHSLDGLPAKYIRFYRKNTPKFIKNSDKIVTVSEFSKNDIVAKYGIAENKISIVPNGFMEHFAPLDQASIEKTREKLTNGLPYFFVIGSLHPRKNLHRTIEAYVQFRRESKLEYPLLISGRPLWKDPSFARFDVPEKISNDIVFTGYLSDSEVGETMGSAYALLFLSLFEGFGVPVVEAFASGVPVVASNTSSIPEVASNAALLANPLYVSDIVSAMKLLTEDNTMRETLIQKGLERSKDFSWQKSASEMWTIIKSLLNV